MEVARLADVVMGTCYACHVHGRVAIVLRKLRCEFGSFAFPFRV